MNRAFVLRIALAGTLLGCGESTKGPADTADQGQPPASADPRVVALFADTSLEAAVRQALGKPIGSLTSQDLLGLTQLEARSRGISALTGIDTLRSLTVLSLAGNQITDLSPLAGLTQLRLLDLEDNQIADLSPLAGLSGLELLVLSGNRISDVGPLLALQRLRSLELGRNPLAQAALGQQVPALQARGVQVTVDQGPVVEPPPAGPVVFADGMLEADVRRAVKKVDPSIPLSRDDLLTITSLDASGMGGRHRIPIAHLAGIEQLANLVALDLQGNRINDLTPLASLVLLRKLALNANQVGDLSPLSGLYDLENLELNFNQVSDLSPLSQLPRLRKLNMYNNGISDLSPLAGLTELQVLVLGNVENPEPDMGINSISDLSPLASLVHLQQLEVPHNQIQDIAVLMHLPEMVRVDLTGNPLNEEARNVYLPALRYSGAVAVSF